MPIEFLGHQFFLSCALILEVFLVVFFETMKALGIPNFQFVVLPLTINVNQQYLLGQISRSMIRWFTHFILQMGEKRDKELMELMDFIEV